MKKAFAETIDSVIMHADTDTIFHLAADIERWPQILPHYRWVKVLNEHNGSRTVEMAAQRGWIPVKWTSEQVIDAARYRVYYHHVEGLTKGMDVEWSLESEGDTVRVTLIHEMNLTIPIVRSVIGRWITGRFFVHYIAGRTLSRIKQLAEEERVKRCAAQS